MPRSRSFTELPDEDPGGLGQSRSLKGRLRRAFGKTDPDGASWSKVHIAGGDADFALDPAPAGAEPDGAQRGTVVSLFRFDGHRWCGGQAARAVS
jgi:hypothetical protein